MTFHTHIYFLSYAAPITLLGPPPILTNALPPPDQTSIHFTVFCVFDLRNSTRVA